MADHDSLRSRPAPARSATGFLALTGSMFVAIAVLSSRSAVATVAVTLALAAAGTTAAARLLDEDPGRVAVGVSG